MTQPAWREQVAALSEMLGTLEGQATREEPGTADLEELKNALDDLRLRTWSRLTASNAEDPRAFHERFRAHRGTEMCRALTADVRTGKLGTRHADLPALGAAARDLSAAVKEATGGNRRSRGRRSSAP